MCGKRSTTNALPDCRTTPQSVPSYDQALANATVFARDLMMERADVASPEYIHKVAQAVAKDHNMEVSVETTMPRFSLQPAFAGSTTLPC